MRIQRSRLPLHITISSLFITLVILLGIVLSLQSFSKTSDIILSGADEIYARIGQEIQLDFKATYRPVVQSLEMLALSPLTDAQSLADRIANLPLIGAAMHNRRTVSAIQVAYANGDYFVVRPLDDDHARQRFGAPGQARYVVDNIDTAASGERQLLRLFLDDSLAVTSREAPRRTDYDPRTRDWYQLAGKRPQAMQPYLFYFIGKVGTTVTLATGTPGVVIATDVSLEQLSETIGRHRITASSEVALIDNTGRTLAYHDSSRLISETSAGEVDIAHMTELGSPVLAHFDKFMNTEPHRFNFEIDGQQWTGSIDKIARDSGLDINILLMSPIDELLSEALAIRNSALTTTALIILLSVPVVWLVAGRISKPLRRLAAEAEAIGRFAFDSPLKTRSHIKEVDDLAAAMRIMKSTINRFIDLINSLAGEKKFDALLEHITRETMNIGQAHAAAAYLVSDDESCLQACVLQAAHAQDIAIGDLPPVALDGDSPLADSIRRQQPTVAAVENTSNPALRPLMKLFDDQAVTLVSVPLRNRQNEAVGVLCLLYPAAQAQGDGNRSAQIAFVRALSGFAAVSIESRHLLKMQEALLESFIKLIAGAIDAKSPYTGGHCQRVPELTRLLAEAACRSSAPAFADYQLSDEQWEALHIASWLHDCGKITTPEYVVDKATKLETIYDRIHEIRMRFEVLKRDAEIRYWQQVADGGDRAALLTEMEAELNRLDDDFAFVAECNEGGEYMAAERLERLRQIAATPWKRTLDDRLGISWEEQQRKQRTPAKTLPAIEKLIDDKAEHLIERSNRDCMPADNPWGFKLDIPEYKYNRGELYNLEVARGTLSEEERYKINDHMVQTIIMLENLPYPKHLREVPEIAGGHHETMDGKGYPKRLAREDMSLTARMMAIADIFEALTASDRPYKKAKTLSESLRILSFMEKDAHIDPDLYRLFLESGVWKTYAEKFLKPEQIDAVDIQQYLN